MARFAFIHQHRPNHLPLRVGHLNEDAIRLIGNLMGIRALPHRFRTVKGEFVRREVGSETEMQRRKAKRAFVPDAQRHRCRPVQRQRIVKAPAGK